ncbi:flavonol synthase/flavanone 3-hydroxylase-like isoform X1 [Panicum miliaceum]|uniref:Flavonol synthase/flavanone 3-hydroxylase-like isoform X1 n=1 Tax=Panicum miliaceum TaxID=4540 RepID=A0A3L6PP81_PANMI|nr:flavonol synthase/flavanone 3-hydroxylase-like isoform X1 [Panicum miliaceum]
MDYTLRPTKANSVQSHPPDQANCSRSQLQKKNCSRHHRRRPNSTVKPSSHPNSTAPGHRTEEEDEELRPGRRGQGVGKESGRRRGRKLSASVPLCREGFKCGAPSGRRSGTATAEHTKNIRDWKEVFDIFPCELPPAPSEDGELVFVNKRPDDGDLPRTTDQNLLPCALASVCQSGIEGVRGGDGGAGVHKLVELIARSLNLRPDRLHGFF